MFNGNAKDYRKQFMFGNNALENVNEYKYLGLTLSKLNKFNMTKNKQKNKQKNNLIVQRARKAMYFVLSNKQKKPKKQTIISRMYT